MSISILIGGDIVPTVSNSHLFKAGRVTELLGTELVSILHKADLRFFNLETPLVDKLTPIIKNGPCLSAHSETVNGIKKMQANLLCLANNHVMDQGICGLKSTINRLKGSEIDYVGVGDNISEAQKPYIVDLKGLKIGVYNCAEHEFSIATRNCPGANPFDPCESFDAIQRLKKECDFALVLYHGGKEHYRYPSPYLQKVCRKFVEKGADVVICQHSHCIGCEEIFKDKTIIYGQGNFIFDHLNNDFWKTSLLVGLEIDKSDIQVRYYPIIKNNERIRIASEEEGQRIIEQFRERSDEIKKPGFVEENYKRFAASMLPNYISTFLGRKMLHRILAKVFGSGFYSNYYDKKTSLALLNYMECEAHHELICAAMSSLNEH